MITTKAVTIIIIAALLAIFLAFMGSTAYAKGYVYLTTLDGHLYCYDANNYSQVATLSAEGQLDMAVPPDGNPVYLAGYRSISVLNTTNYTVEQTIPYGENDNIEDIIAGNDGRIYVATQNRYIKAYDTNTGALVPGAARFLGANPYKLELSPDGSRLYVASCRGSDNPAIYYLNNYNLSVYDTARLDHVRTRVISMTIEGIAASPDGSSLYVLGYNSSTGSRDAKVLKLRASDLATQRTAMGTGFAPEDIVVSPDGGHVYVSERDEGDILVFNADTMALERTVDAGEGLRDMVISPDGRKLYIASDGNGIRIMDTATFNVSRVSAYSSAQTVDICYVNTGSNFTVYHLIDFNLTLITPTPSPSATVSVSGSPSATLMPTMVPVSVTPEPIGVTASPEASPSEASMTPVPSAGVSGTAAASPAIAATPGFYGLASVTAIALAARALSCRRRDKK